MTATTATDPATLARRAYEHFSHDRFDEAAALAAPDCEVVLHAFGQTFHGRDGFREFMDGFKSAFPDIAISVTSQLATAEGVCTEFTARGTHTGPLRTPAGEVPPTGRTVDFTVCEVWDVRDGQLTSLRNYQDSGAIMRQLGLV